MSAPDRRWIRWLVRLAVLVVSVPAGLVLAYLSMWLFNGGNGLGHSDVIVVAMIWPILTVFLYVAGHLATSRWSPWPLS
jgi:hypothetical protein